MTLEATLLQAKANYKEYVPAVYKCAAEHQGQIKVHLV